MRVLITGATGLIGTRIIKDLARESVELVALARSPSPIAMIKDENRFAWTHDQIPPVEALNQIDAIVHLAGESIADGRWTHRKKQRLRDSRVLGTQNLVESLRRLPPETRPSVLVCASAIGYYGETGEALVTEESPQGGDFLAKLVGEWEERARAAEELGLRVVLMRLGVVLAAKGGALKKMGPVILGSGAQWMSWVHLQDVSSFVRYALKNPTVSGAYNLTSCEPVRHREFIKTLSRVRRFPFTVKAPAFAIRLALGEMSQIVLGSQRVFPERTLQSGFRFQHTRLLEALENLSHQN